MMFGKTVRYYNAAGTGTSPAIVTAELGDVVDLVGFYAGPGAVPAASKLQNVPKKTETDSTHVWEEIV